MWTHARESLDVTSIILSNGTYAILFREFANISDATPGKSAHDLMELRRPEIDWVQIARAQGVPGWRVEDVSEFRQAFSAAVRSPGPNLIEVIIG
jgi:acetolactate synthase-1/2/3 large subunit